MSGDRSPFQEAFQNLQIGRLARRAGILALIAAVGAGVLTQFLPRVYRASAKVLPSGTASGLPFADFMAATELSAVLGPRGGSDDPVSAYPEILVSRPVLEKTLAMQVDSLSRDRGRTVLDALHVKGNADAVRYDRGIRRLRNIVAVRPNVRSGIILITVDTNSPALSAFVANGLVSSLNQFNLEVRESRSRAVRQFIEGRLRETEAALAGSEQDLARFREANLRVGNSPRLILEQERLQRQVEVHGELYRLLRRQYEQARIEEHRDTPTFTVIERAEPPVRKHGPSTLLNSLSAAAASVAMLFVVTFADRKRLTSSFRGR